MSHIDGQHAIVTGGSSGIGLELARSLLARGATVTITGRDGGRLARAAADLAHPGLDTVAADATDPASWQRVIDSALARHPRIDVFVANHGAGIRIAPLTEQSPETIERAIAVNLTSVIHGCRAVLPIMRQAGYGHVVTVGSACSYHSWPTWSVYTAAKAGLVGFTRCLHLEMVEWGGKASFYAPGAARTGFKDAADFEMDQSTLPDGAAMAEPLANLIDLPRHMFVENCSAWGTAQIVTPF
jgi:NAD(P)-dependent dehydrogenase (short-subunit alcohol dehydrogenase family)